MSAEPSQVRWDAAFGPTLPKERSDKEKHAAGAKVYKDHVLPIFAAAVRRVEEKTCTEWFDVKPSGLSEALEGNSTRGREVHLDWLIQLLLHAPMHVRRELLEVLCKIADFKPPEPRSPVSESQELRIHRDFVSRVPGAAEWIANEMEKFR